MTQGDVAALAAGCGCALGVAIGLMAGLLWSARRRGELVAAAHAADMRLADARTEVATIAESLERARAAVSAAEADRAALAADLRHARSLDAERSAAAETDRRSLLAAFAELSGRALEQSSDRFLTLADQRLRQAHEAATADLSLRQQAIAQLLEPLRETLGRYEQGLRQLEHDRVGAYEALTTKVAHLERTHEQLRRETGQLVTALRSPQTRGRWGEVQLRRVVEMAGMVRHCDFDEQVTARGDSGAVRPDMVVHLPGGGAIVVDAKVPLDAFLRAMDAEDEGERASHLLAHARQVRSHVDQMAKREYWRHAGGTAEHVVVFVPGDSLLSAAYEQDPSLQEHAMSSGVLLTTPTMLIALLRTVAFGWRQEVLTENAKVVQQLGAELYERLGRLGGHLARLQRHLSSTVDAFNQAVGSLESRVLVTARKLPALGATFDASELPVVDPVEAVPRRLQAPELVETPGPPAGETPTARAEPGSSDVGAIERPAAGPGSDGRETGEMSRAAGSEA